MAIFSILNNLSLMFSHSLTLKTFILVIFALFNAWCEFTSKIQAREGGGGGRGEK
jgi:hypothetical protein